MCGRFAQSIPLGKLTKFDLFDEVDGLYVENYNLSPSQNASVIIKTDGRRIMEQMKWGLMPSWLKSDKNKNGFINARFETLTEKPSFRNLYKLKRCIIPATGFYEWKRDKKEKNPFFINCGRDSDGEFIPMLLCGLYDMSVSDTGEEIITFTIITTEAAGVIKNIHQRMPLIVNRNFAGLWLDSYDPDRDNAVVNSYPVPEFNIYAVTEYVNSPKHKSAECIIPVDNPI